MREASTDRSLLARVRMASGALVVDNFFRSIAAIGKLHPRARRELRNVSLVQNVSYGHSDSHRLDVYRPADATGPLPVVLYVHGGGFRILSKDTHWIMALAFARSGFAVFNIDYRLAPEHRFPAAIEDASKALVWVHRNAHRFGGDPNRIILAGESAGANLVTSLAVATAYRRPEAFAREVFEAGVRPMAAMPACGVLQVSDPGRFQRRKARMPFVVADRLHEVSEAYLGASRHDDAGGIDMADPLIVLERGVAPERPLPPFFTAVGTRDPLLDDTRRLKVALTRLGVRCDVSYFPGELHAFHALVWRAPAIRFWNETFAFIESCEAAGTGG